jgi:hypothetical protein
MQKEVESDFHFSLEASFFFRGTGLNSFPWLQNRLQRDFRECSFWEIILCLFNSHKGNGPKNKNLFFHNRKARIQNLLFIPLLPSMVVINPIFAVCK